ncbi:MAG: ATP-binding protein, partial [Candidatus Aenigmarchaeota archaeon]|nr:ATP-binding protein [Candidatus Aenigmarchaeota archaeon]
MNRFKETVNKEVSKAIYLPYLELSLETKNISVKANTSIVFAVSNVGSGLANNVAINLCESDDFAIESGEEQYGIIAPNQSVSGEFIVNPLKEGDLPINVDISYSNLKNEVNEISFAEVISIYSQREFKRIESPYIIGTPVTGREMFFGRGDVIENILGKLKGVYQDNVLVLYGQRRTGKTSILYQLKDDYIKPPYHAVLIDMQKLKSANTYRLCRKIAEMCISALSKDKVKYEWPEHKEFGQIFEDDPIGALDDFFEELERKLPDHRILLLFDEFEGLIENIADGKVDKDLFPFLRSVMQHQENVSFIFTGADKLREMLEDYASIMFNIAEFVPIGYLKPEEARELITTPVSGKMEYQENAVSHIIKSTDAHPYYIQLVCQSLVDRMNEEERNVVTIIDVEKVIANLISVGTYFDHLWNQSSPNEKLSLSCIAQETATIDDWVRYDTISEFMEKTGSELREDG